MTLFGVGRFLRRLLLAGLIIGGAPALAAVAAVAAGTLQFADYPASAKWSGKTARIDLGADETLRNLRPVIREIIAEDIARGPNFAGAYRLIEVGCGTACQSIVVVDLTGGNFLWAPISATAGVTFRKDSRLVIVNEDRTHKTGRRYLLLRNDKLVIVR
jgi:hypothetical protein